MIQRGEDFGFALEPREPLGIAQRTLAGRTLMRDVALQLRVAGAVDLAHAARAELAVTS